MENNTPQEKWINEALNSLDGIQRASANPFLFTRVQQQLALPSSPWDVLSGYLAKPAFALIAGILFIAINFYVASRQQQEQVVKQEQATAQMFAAEFGANGIINNELNNDR